MFEVLIVELDGWGQRSRGTGGVRVPAVHIAAEVSPALGEVPSDSGLQGEPRDLGFSRPLVSDIPIRIKHWAEVHHGAGGVHDEG